MHEFTIEVFIKRPVKVVFAFLVNINKATTWNPSLTHSKKLSPGPVAVGTRLLYVGKFMDQDYESEAECTAIIPNQRFSTKTTSGPITLEIDSTFTATKGGTHLSTLYRGESSGFFKFADTLLIVLMENQFQEATQNLKTLLEKAPS